MALNGWLISTSNFLDTVDKYDKMVYISKIKNEINKKISWNLSVITFTRCLILVHQFAVFLKQWIYSIFPGRLWSEKRLGGNHRRCSIKNVFLRFRNFIKKRFSTGFFLWILRDLLRKSFLQKTSGKLFLSSAQILLSEHH